MNRLILPLLFFSIPAFTQAINPGEDEVFRPNEIATIRLTLSPEDKAFLLNPENADSEIYLEATFEMTNSVMDTILEKKVGVRLRGNTSRYNNKKPFKIDFREFDGKKFFDYKKFNLKPNTNDPSQIREPLTLQFYRLMNVPAARTHPVRVYMNEEYMGTYINVEQLDDEFLDRRFGHEDGFLYKCSYGANLQHDGQVFNNSLYESEINEDEDTREEIDHFTEVLNNTSNDNFKTEIEKVFNVDMYLRQLAVESLLGHWDGYSWNQNNFYLYYNGKDKIMEYLPYDVDNTWGIDWVGIDWGTRNIMSWYKSGQPRPLTARILNVSEYRNKYVDYLNELLDNYFTTEFVSPITDAYKQLLDQAVQEDTYFDDSFGFTYQDFLNSFTMHMNNHVKYGILEYLQTRREKALEQLPIILATDQPQNSRDILYPNPSNDDSFFYQSKEIAIPRVYTITGINVDINTEAIDEKTLSVKLKNAVPGVYIVRTGSTIQKWIYR